MASRNEDDRTQPSIHRSKSQQASMYLWMTVCDSSAQRGLMVHISSSSSVPALDVLVRTRKTRASMQDPHCQRRRSFIPLRRHLDFSFISVRRTISLNTSWRVHRAAFLARSFHTFCQRCSTLLIILLYNNPLLNGCVLKYVLQHLASRLEPHVNYTHVTEVASSPLDLLLEVFGFLTSCQRPAFLSVVCKHVMVTVYRAKRIHPWFISHTIQTSCQASARIFNIWSSKASAKGALTDMIYVWSQYRSSAGHLLLLGVARGASRCLQIHEGCGRLCDLDLWLGRPFETASRPSVRVLLT